MLIALILLDSPSLEALFEAYKFSKLLKLFQMAAHANLAYTVSNMQDKGFFKELGWVMALKLLLLWVVWSLCFHKPQTTTTTDLSPILLDKR